MKKLMVCMLSVLLLWPPMQAAAAEEEAYKYTLLPDGTAEIQCVQTDITKAEIPESVDGRPVTALADGCFANCTALTGVAIPDTVTTIGEQAFYGCMALTEITIPESVSEIRAYAFDTTESMTAIHVEQGNPAYQDVDGVLFSADGTILIKYPEARPDTEYTVPDSCTELADWAFVGTQYLEQADLGNVQKIGEDAFYNCMNLRSAAIPEGVSELIGGVFCYCAALESVTLPSTLKSIGDNCFYSCVSLTDVVLPEGLTSIGNYAFFHCTSLNSLTAPASVETVMMHSLGYCYDADKEEEIIQEGFMLYVHKGSPVKTYAKSNGIPYEILPDFDILAVLLYVVGGVIVILLAAIGIVLIRRRKADKK